MLMQNFATPRLKMMAAFGSLLYPKKCLTREPLIPSGREGTRKTPVIEHSAITMKRLCINTLACTEAVAGGDAAVSEASSLCPLRRQEAKGGRFAYLPTAHFPSTGYYFRSTRITSAQNQSECRPSLVEQCHDTFGAQARRPSTSEPAIRFPSERSP
jgi:hypothetical protein